MVQYGFIRKTFFPRICFNQSNGNYELKFKFVQCAYTFKKYVRLKHRELIDNRTEEEKKYSFLEMKFYRWLQYIKKDKI